MRLWELMGATLGFLYHPNIWIRQSASFQLGGGSKLIWVVRFQAQRHFWPLQVNASHQATSGAFYTPPFGISFVQKSEK